MSGCGPRNGLLARLAGFGRILTGFGSWLSFVRINVDGCRRADSD